MENLEDFPKHLKTSNQQRAEKPGVETFQDENSSVDFLNLSSENLKLAQKVFGIHLTFDRILNFLRAKNLLSFRLVDKFWNEQITKLITASKNHGIKIRFHFNSSSNSFHVGSAANGNGRTLAQLNEYLENSGRLFCYNFVIADRRIENPQMVKFLSLHGKQIKFLHLKWLRRICFDGEESLKVDSLRKLLVHQCPNLERLQLSGIIAKDNNEKLFPIENSAVILPHLKSFSFSRFFPQIGEIINASPNLKSVNGDVVSAVNILTSKNPSKIQLAKKLKIVRHETELQDFVKFSEAEPQLKKLNLTDPIGYFIFPWGTFTKPNVVPQFFVAMTKLLDSCKNSLCHIDIAFRREYFHSQVKWPRMENVKSLSVVTMSPQDFVNLPPNFISDVFPNVEKIQLKFVKHGVKFWLPESFLNSNVALLKLKKLDIKINSYEKPLGNLNLLAPNLEILSVKDIYNFPLHSKWIWGFKKLRKLNLQIKVHFDSDYSNNKFSSLLMNFTGLDEETCLNRNLDAGEEIEGIEIHHESPSLLNCKDLEMLNLEFACSSQEDSESSDSLRLMAEKLKEFGLERMGNLKLDYSFKYEKKI